MGFRTLGFVLLIITTTSFAQGRKPAVEDFVGIEIDQPQVLPQGTESLYNLEQDLSKLEAKKKNMAKQAPATEIVPEQPLNISTVFGISIIFGLPLVVWFLVMSHFKKKASQESASNIEVLEKYRKERERKSEEKIRKVS